MKKLLPLLLLPLLFGCAQVATYNMTYFQPVNVPAKTFNYLDQTVSYASYSNDDVEIAASIVEYNTYIIVASLKIVNVSGKTIEPESYSIALFDGKDYKSIRLLTRDEVQSVKNTVAGGPSGGAIQDQIINTSVNTLMSAVDAPTKGKLVRIIQYGIDNYFSFRPIWIKGQREGFLCFLPNFKLEFPLTLRIKMNGKVIDLKFVPKKP